MVQQKQKYKSKFKMVLITLFKIKLDQELLNKTLIEDKLEIENEFISNKYIFKFKKKIKNSNFNFNFTKLFF